MLFLCTCRNCSRLGGASVRCLFLHQCIIHRLICTINSLEPICVLNINMFPNWRSQLATNSPQGESNGLSASYSPTIEGVGTDAPGTALVKQEVGVGVACFSEKRVVFGPPDLPSPIGLRTEPGMGWEWQQGTSRGGRALSLVCPLFCTINSSTSNFGPNSRELVRAVKLNQTELTQTVECLSSKTEFRIVTLPDTHKEYKPIASVFL